LTIQHTYQIFQNKQRLNFVIIFCTVLFIFANIVLDFLFTLFRNSSFYILEAILFSVSFWILFLPLLLVFTKFMESNRSIRLNIAFICSVILIHQFAYSALVWILSKIIYYHTFSYWQTFSFSLSNYFIITAIIYLVTFAIFSKKKSQTESTEIEVESKEENFITSIIVADSNNKKIFLQVDDILYFSANSPYISIYHSSKKYLHTETLKSLETQLDGKQFVRIHKSHIVNLSKIESIQSRQNGDYDITLINKTILRLSRSYTKNFKLNFHQLTTK